MHHTGRARASELGWRGAGAIQNPLQDLPENQFDPEFVYLSEDGADFLAGRALLLVGIDTPSVDGYASTAPHSHKILLDHRVAILEGTRLAEVPDGDYDLVCLPLKFAGLEGSPVRAILIK